MQGSNSFPHGWSEVLPYILAALIGASTRWLPSWQNRKKPEADVGESIARAKRTDAETRKLDAEAGKTFGEVVVAFSTKLTEANQEIAEQRERHVKRLEFLEQQLLHRQEQEETARSRAHDAMDEVNRAVAAIKKYEMILTEKKIEFVPFTVKTFKEITAHSEDG